MVVAELAVDYHGVALQLRHAQPEAAARMARRPDGARPFRRVQGELAHHGARARRVQDRLRRCNTRWRRPLARIAAPVFDRIANTLRRRVRRARKPGPDAGSLNRSPRPCNALHCDAPRDRRTLGRTGRSWERRHAMKLAKFVKFREEKFGGVLFRRAREGVHTESSRHRASCGRSTPGRGREQDPRAREGALRGRTSAAIEQRGARIPVRASRASRSSRSNGRSSPGDRSEFAPTAISCALLIVDRSSAEPPRSAEPAVRRGARFADRALPRERQGTGAKLDPSCPRSRASTARHDAREAPEPRRLQDAVRPLRLRDVRRTSAGLSHACRPDERVEGLARPRSRHARRARHASGRRRPQAATSRSSPAADRSATRYPRSSRSAFRAAEPQVTTRTVIAEGSRSASNRADTIIVSPEGADRWRAMFPRAPPAPPTRKRPTSLT